MSSSQTVSKFTIQKAAATVAFGKETVVPSIEPQDTADGEKPSKRPESRGCVFERSPAPSPPSCEERNGWDMKQKKKREGEVHADVIGLRL